MQTDCAALTGLLSSSSSTQGFSRFAASTLGFAAPRFQRFPSGYKWVQASALRDAILIPVVLDFSNFGIRV